MLQASLQKVVEKLLRGVQAVCGERLGSLALFGPVGRGTPGFDLDIDFLIVARELPIGRMTRVKEFERVEEIGSAPQFPTKGRDSYLPFADH